MHALKRLPDILPLSPLTSDPGSAVPFTSVPPSGGPMDMIRARIGALGAEAAAVCVAGYEDASDADIEEGIAQARVKVSQALDLLDVVTVLYGETSTDSEPEVVDVGDRPSGIPVEVDAVGEVVVLARMGLRARLRALSHLGETSRSERLSLWGSALRTIQKSLSALDRAMARRRDWTATFDYYANNVSTSLDVRRRYVAFNDAVAPDATPSGDELPRRLRTIGNFIAGLLGKPIAKELRPGDRALLLLIQSRLRAWLFEGSDPDVRPSRRVSEAIHATNGLRLFQDIANAASMFLDVNKREELIRHDALVVREVLPMLPPTGDIPPDLAARIRADLQAIRGRSAQLDALWDAQPVPSVHELRAALLRIESTLRSALDFEQVPASGRRVVVPSIPAPRAVASSAERDLFTRADL